MISHYCPVLFNFTWENTTKVPQDDIHDRIVATMTSIRKIKLGCLPKREFQKDIRDGKGRVCEFKKNAFNIINDPKLNFNKRSQILSL